MKKLLLVMVLLVLTGCGKIENTQQQALSFRDKILDSHNIYMLCDISADFGTAVHEFTLECTTVEKAKLSFKVVNPESISGISGYVCENINAITFDDVVLTFPLATEQGIPPLAGPWIIYKALCGGYISSTGSEDGVLHIVIDDEYNEENLKIDVWVNENAIPERADILLAGRRVLSLEFRDFRIL